MSTLSDFPRVSDALLRRLDVPIPRYTSYPTAPVWTESVGRQAYVAALSRAGRERPDAPLSVYVHIPFCRERCSFCGCNVVIARSSAKADAYVDNFLKTHMAGTDANDLLYAFDASRDYDPSHRLDQINAPVMFVNSADDQINPPELGIAEREIKNVKRGRFVRLPITDQTRGHGTHTLPAVWKQYLEQLLAESQH